MRISSIVRHGVPALVLAGFLALVALSGRSIQAQDLDPAVQAAEAKRIAAIKKTAPTVVAIFSPGGQGGGSGVLIDEEGYVLTNFHVVEGSGPVMQCGLSDGILYDGVLVGLDKVGDVALVKLLPRKEGDKFPFARLGDSDKIRAGDWSLAMGNPFLLATDFTPTVTFGLISGTNRYQYPAGTLLEYTDCIQIDTSINPGNSGGPLFNLDGELIGINGRGSFEKRGRVNSGVGYAISINQIKNFLGHLRAGLDTDHASLGAVVASDEEEGAVDKVSVVNILDDCDASRRGLQIGDELRKFAGRDVTTVNQYKNIIGIFPRGWRLPLSYRHAEKKLDKVAVEDKEVLVRLMGVQKQEIKDPNQPKAPPGPQPGPPRVPTKSPATKFYVAKDGFANYYFNQKARERLFADFAKHGDFKKLRGKWVLEGDGKFGEREASFQIVLAEADGKSTVNFTQGGDITFDLEPLNKDNSIERLKGPPGSGGLMMALYQYRQLLTMPVGDKTFESNFYHGGHEPFYVPGPAGGKPNFLKERIDTEVLRTKSAGVAAKWYFALKDHTLAGFEVMIQEQDDDPCEVYLLDYKQVEGRLLPQRIEVRYGNERYATLNIKKIELK